MFKFLLFLMFSFAFGGKLKTSYLNAWFDKYIFYNFLWKIANLPTASISLLEKNQIWSIGQQIVDLDPNQFFETFEDRGLLRNSTAFLQTISFRAANIVSISSTNGNVFMWDLLHSEFRARVLANANYSLILNESLSWSSIPVDVQGVVAARLQNVSNNPQFSSISSQLSAVVSTIRYDILIDTSIVKEKIALVISELVDIFVNASENARYTKKEKNCVKSKANKKNIIIDNIKTRDYK